MSFLTTLSEQINFSSGTGFIPHFTGLGEPKMTMRQGLLAYHLVRGTLKGPASKLKEVLDNKDSPYFDFRPDDILPLLRPVRTSSFPTQQEYRGCRMLSICCIDYRTTFSYTAMPSTVFVFDVHYCLRRHTVEVRALNSNIFIFHLGQNHAALSFHISYLFLDIQT